VGEHLLEGGVVAQAAVVLHDDGARILLVIAAGQAAAPACTRPPSTALFAPPKDNRGILKIKSVPRCVTTRGSGDSLFDNQIMTDL
jgi:hypothetical protein